MTKKDIIKGEFALYPKMIAPKDLRKKIEQAYQNGELEEYEFESYSACKYQDKWYTRVEPHTYLNKDCQLSDGTVIKEGEHYWLKLEPIEVLLDLEHDMALAKNIIFAIPDVLIGLGNSQKKILEYIRKVFLKDIEKSLNLLERTQLREKKQKQANKENQTKTNLLYQKQILENLKEQKKNIENDIEKQNCLIRTLENKDKKISETK